MPPQHASSSPPQTPPFEPSDRIAARRGTHPRPSVRETFLDDFNPADNANDSNESGDERDPHDLSLSPKHAARTSIVDNMLLSLDQFASGSLLDDYRLFNSVFETDLCGNGSPESIAQRRYRGHTFSSSVSSEVECTYDESTGRYATQPARSRRSNSSSNYHTSLRRYGSTRSREGTGSRGQLYDYRINSNIAPPANTRASRNGNRGSSSPSTDLTSMQTGRLEAAGERRSASLDFGTRQPFISFPDLVFDLDSSSYGGLDAAPTPSVPGGPSKFHSSPQAEFAGTSNPQQSRTTPVASRRNSVKSPRSNDSRKTRPENLGTATIRSHHSDLANLGESGLELPPTIPASLDPPAPSPTISFNKPIFPAPPDPAPAAKERPGFFRRVFGSSKVSTAISSEYHPSDHVFAQENDHKDPSGFGPNAKSWRQPLKNSAAGINSHREGGTHQVVTKKSSFFRRRKKSVAESAPPPIFFPPELSGHLRVLEPAKPEAISVSSVGKGMNPSSTADPGSRPLDRRPAAEAQNLGGSPTQNQRGSLVTATQGPSKAKYSLYPTVPPSSAPEASSLGLTSSVDEASTIIRPGSWDPSHPADQRQEPEHPWRGKGVDSNSNDVDNGSGASTLQTKLKPEEIPGSSLSPVVESFSQTGAVPEENLDDIALQNPPKLKEAHGVFPSDVCRDNEMGRNTAAAAAGLNESPRVSTSEVSNYYTASEAPTALSIEPKRIDPLREESHRSDGSLGDEPTDSDREQARMLFEGQEQVVGNEPAAAWLGDPDRASIRNAYMELFDWSNLNILAALRSLCTRLVLKGETQQVDRVLDAFSTRWCACNPRHSFKAADVVHTICYSLLLLNTDLHLADIEQKMTKTQFVRNTMPTIHRVATEAAPDESLNGKSRASTQDPMSPTDDHDRGFASMDRPLNQPAKLVNRLSRTDLSAKITTDPDNETGPLVNTPFIGSMRVWEQQVEAVLRDFYSSIQKQKLPLYGASTEKEGPRSSASNLLGPYTSGLRRSPSTVSKSGSDIYPRGRSADSRYGTARWSSKPRSRARLYPPSTMGSSRTSLDDQASLWSPSASSTWSKYSSGKLTSASVDSFGSDFPRGDYQQSIGFANALSQAIIREDSAHSITSIEDAERDTPLLEDETLQLAGAPWAKEGSLKHKHHLDSVDKRAKDRNWNECFAVIQQGWMRLFSFNASVKGARQKPKQRHPGGLVVGGGNWTENAEETWKFLLRQTIASALPPPGYSKSRPHVWALSLPTGAVHLFQVGTPEIVREFVSSANYWSARLSKEPLIGGISNIEYGWSDAVINSALITAESSRTPPSSSGARPSIQSSIRSSIDQQGIRPRLPADRVLISDWAPPQQSMVASALPEADQLKALQAYVKNVEDELQRHNELRSAMILAFSPRHPNASKALANWERKSSYLLREIVKFRTYIDSLSGALEQKNRIYAAREETATEE
ncbi:Sec7 domain protein [Aspergillus uvarum CBS 121591]|uniref:Sec7 domain protein n=1 Tax=Aspergillus uvarum CBS 121591 TaxID=1448315 RepID=A0A319BRB9_9EURO|nr:Sec7 domain protein [Aspergillus uvarum CBS 121591]PYH76056.1 Sec7 domain protein [Aspergillus uvarum CBS 121591]